MPGAALGAEAPACAACGRLLADPVSRARGLGPVCHRRLSGHTAPRPRKPVSTAPVQPSDGQLALPIPAFVHVPVQPRLSRDLREQLTYRQRQRITTIPTGSYL